MAFSFRNTNNFRSILVKYFSFRNETKSMDSLIELFRCIGKTDFDKLLAFLKENTEITENFSHYIKNLFEAKPFNLSLTEADILSETAFFPELKKRLLDKILPNVENEDTVSYLVDTVSVRPEKDLKYFRGLRKDQLEEFFRLLKIDDFILKKEVKHQLLFSLNILAWRIIGTAMDVEVVKMAPEYRNFDNPFLGIQSELDLLNRNFKENPEDFYINPENEYYRQIKIYIGQGLNFVALAFKNSSKYGISSRINQSLLKIKQQLERMNDILSVMVIDNQRSTIDNSIQLFINILKYKSHKNNLRELISDRTTLMSHLITAHTSEVESYYSTSSAKYYAKMFLRASGGGVVVGGLCVLNMLYSHIPGSDFSHAVLYSFNYAMGFVMIYLMKYSLAIKQPATIAATMAKVLSNREKSGMNYKDFAHLVSKLFRSQFIAVAGNVLFAFPVALSIIYGLDILIKQNLAIESSSKILQDLNPLYSKAIFHACLTGFFLFLSGLISGNIANSSVFYHIPKRIEKNPFLNYFFGGKTAKRLSIYYAKNWAGIISNVWFGVFLGAAFPIGLFLGLDLDIRHIAFASGNFALGLYGADFSVGSYVFFLSFFTVFLIGFFNFAVSFGLSMILAFRSVNVSFGEMIIIHREILRYFMKNPLRFFLPVRSGISVEKKDDTTTKSEEH